MTSKPWNDAPSVLAADEAQAARPVVRVWDVPVRVTHWLMVLCFAGAWLSAESEQWRLLHLTLGYTLAGLVAFRLAWGLVGTRHARFADFVRGPGAALGYLRGLAQGRAAHHSGHNPAGALAIVGLLVLAALTTGLGWALEQDLAGHWLEEAHEAAAVAMLVLAGVHVLGVIAGSLAHRENLVRAMVTGRKRAGAGETDVRAWSALAALVLIFVALFWIWQWQSAPAPEAVTTRAAAAGLDDDDDDDD